MEVILAKFNIRLFYDGETFTDSIYDGGRSVAPIGLAHAQSDLRSVFGPAVQAWSLLAVPDVAKAPRKRRRVVKEPGDAAEPSV